MTQFPTTITAMKQGLKAGEFTAVQLTDHVYQLIEERDSKIKGFLTLNKEEALQEAEAADQRGYGEDAPLLNGIPIAIKDNILTDGLKTTAASKMLENFIPTYDATVIRKLKEAGAVIIGKVNMDEFAMGGSSETSYFHETHNPWNLDRVPGGSSGGSGAVVASRQVPGALGTDTGGSVRNPAAYNGVVGMKPTYGTVSRFGAIAFGSSLDQVGPITTTVEDNALLLEAIAGTDPADMTTLPDLDTNFSAKIGQSLEGLKIAYPVEFQSDKIDPEIKAAVDEAVEFFRSQGAIVEEVSLEHIRLGISVYYAVSSAEGASNLQRFDGIRYGYRSPNARDLDDIYVMSRSEGLGDEVKRRIMIGTYCLGEEVYEDIYLQAAKVRTLTKEDFSQVFADYDLIIGPTTTSVAFEFGSKQDPVEMYVADLLTVPANIAGLPAISIPAGFNSEKMPIGLQIMGPARGEAVIYQAAAAYEHAHSDAYQAPEL
ncbi:Asp-tRNA(Asn)/Glu-tRNA(Gln) amidotransferase subunit GatA [Hutsoniella sourekii]